jgi:hypothetical protein
MRSPETVAAVFDRIQTLTAAMRRWVCLVVGWGMLAVTTAFGSSSCTLHRAGSVRPHMLCPTCTLSHTRLQCARVRLVRDEPRWRGVRPAGRILRNRLWWLLGRGGRCVSSSLLARAGCS